MHTWFTLTIGIGLGAMLAVPGRVCGEDDPASWPVLYRTDFEQGAADWKPTESEAWEVRAEGAGHAYHQHRKAATYQPPHRSPHHIAWLEGIEVTDFQLDVKIRSTHEDYGHRDVCLFFGGQDPANFYYVHLGKETDDHANQIFLVKEAPRTKISTVTSSGTPWDEAWHHVRVIRRIESGRIEVFFDDLEKPMMVAEDRSFTWGRIGLGSFDDTAAFDDVELRGRERD